jgi:lysophospholipase L1-like esterase
MKLSYRRYGLLALSILSLAMTASAVKADGPTPYPDAKDESAWPGKGPIRLFAWMNDNRNWFWTQREKDQGKVVFVGDSLIGGWKGPLLAKNFPDLKIANRGIGGDVSRGVLFRFKEDVLDLKPSAIVICCGSNDLSCHADPAVTQENIEAIIAQAREYSATVPIVLCQIPPRDVKDAPTKPGAHKDLNERIVKIGEGKEHLAVVDTFTPMADAEGMPIPEYFSNDKIHPVAAGYDKWAELLKPAFETLGIK